jgi:hypothetical protein
MNPAIRKMMIPALETQIEVCRLQCAYLSSEFEAAPSFEQRAVLAHRWDHVLKIGYSAQFMLDLMNRQDRKG